MSAGVFDSGAGGLTVLNELIRLNPESDFVYFGDTAYLPYGEKTPAQIASRVDFIGEKLKNRGAEILVAACGTASTAVSGKTLCGRPFYGAIEPTAKEAAKGDKIAVLCTRATAQSGFFGKAIQKHNPKSVVTTVFSGKLVQYAEQNVLCGDELESELKRVLLPINEGDFDVLALGCTHFPLLLQRISEILRDGIRIVNIAQETAKSVGTLKKGEGRLEIMCSGDPDEFSHAAKRIIKGRSFTIEKFD